MQWSCDELKIVVNALRAAGPNLTQGAFINAMERSTKHVKSGFFADITFSPTNHFGSNQFRTLQLNGECLCWKIKGPLRDYLV